MNTEKLNDLIFKVRCFHYSTSLPLWLFLNDELRFNVPKVIETSSSILNNKNTPSFILEPKKTVQLITNEYSESYLGLNIYNDNLTILVGPFLLTKITSGEITNNVRNGLIPFHKKSEISTYYDSLPVLNERRIFYTSKFIEDYFNNENQKDIVSRNENSELNINTNAYDKQKNEYRIQSFVHSPYSIEQDVCRTISNGDTKNAKRIISQINLTPHAKLASNAIRSYKNSMICSCTFMTRAAISGGINPDIAFTLSDTYINSIENTQSLKELENFESTMIEGFTDLVNKQKNQTYTQAVLDTIYYIDNHLCENITIDMIAKEVYLNPSYLSTLFHKETGKTISEWIKTKRIQESVYLVLNTKEDFAEIAFFYRFCSQSYFVQSFKKVMGKTPGEYRRKGR